MSEIDVVGLMEQTEKQATCERHGEFVSKLVRRSRHGLEFDVWRSCDACAGEERDAADEQRRKDYVRTRIERCEIPSRYRNADTGQLHDLIRKKLVDWLQASTARRASGPLILHGPTGTGKTFAACAALRQWIEHGSETAYGRYRASTDITARIRNTWSRKSEITEADIVGELMGSTLLVLDDLGAGRANDMELLHEPIDRRYRDGNMARTIVCTNVALNKFNDSFGHRTADRLREGAVAIPVLGKSRREPAP